MNIFTDVGYISDIWYAKGADKTKGLLYRVVKNPYTNGLPTIMEYLKTSSYWCDYSELNPYSIQDERDEKLAQLV